MSFISRDPHHFAIRHQGTDDDSSVQSASWITSSTLNAAQASALQKQLGLFGHSSVAAGKDVVGTSASHGQISQIGASAQAGHTVQTTGQSTAASGSSHASHVTSLAGISAASSGGAGGVSMLSSQNLALAGLSGQHIDYSKLQSGLSDIFIASQIAANSAGTAGRDAALNAFTVDNSHVSVGHGLVAIDAVAADGNGAALLTQLQALGLQGGSAYQGMVGGYIPLDSLDNMTGLAELKFARPVLVDYNTGSVLSQDDHAMATDTIRTNDSSLTGSGLSIGILSDSFDTATTQAANGQPLTIHYANDIATGDLPAGIVVLQDATPGGGEDEGRGMAQQIYDVAPGAQLSFATANGGEANFANNIMDLQSNALTHADIIVDDVRYLAEPMFQDGIVSNAVDQVVANGALYFSSAGNYADNSYESEFRNSGQTITATSLFTGTTGTYVLHDFDPGAGVDVGQHVSVAGGTILLQWDQPFFSVDAASGGSQSDLAMLLWFDSNNNNQIDAGEVLSLDNGNNIGDDPVEGFSDSNDDFQLLIGVRETTPGDASTAVLPEHIKYVGFDSVTIDEYDTNSGTDYGHSNAAGAIAVGAADWYQTPGFGQNPPLGEYFTSKGGVPIYLNEDGTRLATPEQRNHVDITAPDGGNTTFFVSDTIRDADTSPNFYGTSSAAPNAAALAALLLQAYPNATKDEILQAMKNSAIDIQDLKNGDTISTAHDTGTHTGAGTDAFTGAGLIQGPGALAALQAIETVKLYDQNDNLVGTYGSIQGAVDAASDGYRIVAGARTYDENVTVDKDVTIQGANVGVDGSSGNGARGQESILDGGFNVTASGVTIDGFQISGTANHGGNDAGVYLTGNDFTLTNTILDGPNGTSSATYGVLTQQTTGLEISSNLVEGYDIGTYVSGGDSTGSIHDNVFQGVDGSTPSGLGNGVNSETSHVTIEDNSFDGIYGGVINLFPFGPEVVDVNDYVSDNTFTNDPARPIQIYPTNSTHNITGTDIAESFNGDTSGASGAFTFYGMGGNDHLFGGSQGDYLDGGTGADEMTGHAGDDVYVVDSASDVVNEDANEGTDEIRTALASYSLAGLPNVENLTGTSNSGQSLTGNGANNVVTGGNGNDVIDLSAGGTDTGNGNGGDDAFLFGATFTGADRVDGGAGKNDQIGLSGNYTSANALVMTANTIANVEAIVLAAGFDYNITTNDGNVAAGQVLNIYGSALGAGDNLTFNGSAEQDGSFIVYGGGGIDNLTGGAKNDGFFFGPGNFTASDHVDGGAGTNDQIGLDGTYGTSSTPFALGGNYSNIEAIVLYAGGHYNIKANGLSVSAGQHLTIYGTPVTSSFTFDGSAEHNGSFTIFGGTAGDRLIGGGVNDVIYGLGGADTLKGGAGSDTFAYTQVSESTGPKFDHITDMDFSTDKIDLPGSAGSATYDGDFHGGTLSKSTFNADLTADLNGILQANHAVLFEADSGNLAGKWFLVVDANHQAGYQANADYVIQVDFTGSPPPTTEHFII